MAPANRRLVAVVLTLIAFAWFGIANVLPEGAILWTISRGHGITVADGPGIAALVAAVMVLRPVRTIRRTVRRLVRRWARLSGL